MTDQNQSTNYATGINEIIAGSFMAGFGAQALGWNRSRNPHPVESTEWQDWLRGFEASENAKWQTLEVHVS